MSGCVILLGRGRGVEGLLAFEVGEGIIAILSFLFDRFLSASYGVLVCRLISWGARCDRLRISSLYGCFGLNLMRWQDLLARSSCLLYWTGMTLFIRNDMEGRSA